MSGLTNKGFEIKTFEDIVASMSAKAKTLFGDDIDTEETSVIGKFIRIGAEEIANAWLEAVNVYNANYIDTAEGTQLENLIHILGEERQPATKATGYVKISGTVGTLIDPGLEVMTSDKVFLTTNPITYVIPEAGYITIAIEAEEVGVTYNVKAGTITKLKYPNNDIVAITNELATIGGADIEDDVETRSRWFSTILKTGNSSIDAIKSNVMDIEGVLKCEVYENDSGVTDSVGRPPNTFETIFLGGDESDVANAVFDKKPAGIATFGTRSVTIQDNTGRDRVVKITPAQTRNIIINVTLSVTAAFIAQDLIDLKNKYITYIGGTDSLSEYQLGTEIGQKLVYNKMLATTFAYDSVTDCTFTWGILGGQMVSTDITTNYNMKNIIDLEDITITLIRV